MKILATVTDNKRVDFKSGIIEIHNINIPPVVRKYLEDKEKHNQSNKDLEFHKTLSFKLIED